VAVVNIVLVAEEAAGIQMLRLVDKTPHHLITVLTGTEHGDGTERGVTVAAVARELGVEVMPAAAVTDRAFAAELRRRHVDVLLNVHSLYLIDPDVLAAPRIGTFNLHPGALPEYAGLNVPSWAVYNGETDHGVTLHWVAPKVDAGPIAFSTSFPITPSDTGLSVSAKCVQHGMPLISDLLDCLTRGPETIPAVEQDLTRRRYFGREVPHRGWVPWCSSARQVIDFIRACDYGPWPSPWGIPRTGAPEVEIVRAARTGEMATEAPGTVDRSGEGGVRVATADEWVLVSRLRVDGTSVAPSAVLQPGTSLMAGV
jgi:UDP-4-amino-4-deoxy-L-arabinose formyltransferase/UDP-glucuronic acid dehydrogenase (UDP-4-keto-hexauronic acid decarboxylating)